MIEELIALDCYELMALDCYYFFNSRFFFSSFSFSTMRGLKFAPREGRNWSSICFHALWHLKNKLFTWFWMTHSGKRNQNKEISFFTQTKKKRARSQRYIIVLPSSEREKKVEKYSPSCHWQLVQLHSFHSITIADAFSFSFSLEDFC